MPTNLLASGAGWLGGVLRDHASEPIHYVRGTQRCALRARVGSTQWQVQDSQGFLSVMESRDYIVTRTDLTFGAGAVTPQKGDRIEEIRADQTVVHEVLPFGPGDECFRTDPFGVQTRVHTKQVDQR